MRHLLHHLTRLTFALAILVLETVSAHQAQAQQSTQDAIQERGTLRISVTQAPPWFVKDIRSGEWKSGLGISLGNGMAKALGVELETVEVTWGAAIAALQSDRIDAMLFISPTAERAVAVDFATNPVVFLSQAVLAAEGVDATTWAALNNADIQRYPNNATSVAAFQSGRAEAVSLMLPPLLAARQSIGMGVLSVPTPAYTAPANIAVRREADKTWRDWLDITSFNWYETGRIQGWYEEFLADVGLEPTDSPPIQRELIFMR